MTKLRTLGQLRHRSVAILVRKASGGWHPVIDLKNLNAHIHEPRFRMFTTNSVLSSVRKGDYAFENKVYQFQVLPFGLNTAPQVFTHFGAHGDRLSAPSGDLGDTISTRLVNSPPRPSSFTPTSSSANKYTRPCRVNSKQKEIRAGPDSGSPVSQNPFTSGLGGSFPSRVQSLGDSCTRTPSILPPCTNLYSGVPAYGITQLGLTGLIPLGRLYLRPLQRHFHSLGLTDRFTPPRRSDPLVLANLLRHWQDPRFLTSGIPIRTFQADFTIFTDATRRGGALIWGIPRFQVPGPVQTASSTSIVWSSRRFFVPFSIGPSAPGPPGYDGYGQFDSSFVYQQARRDPLPHLVTFDSRASPLVRGSEHHSPSKTYPRLSERDSRPPISSESANIDRVVPSPRNRATYLQGLGDTRSQHVCNSVELPPSSVHVSNSGAKSPSGGCSVSRLAGGQCTCFPHSACSAKSFRSFGPPRRQK